MSESSPPPVVPIEHAGKWIAWNYEETAIVATGDSYAATKQAAEERGESRPILARAPDASVRFVGGHS